MNTKTLFPALSFFVVTLLVSSLKLHAAGSRDDYYPDGGFEAFQMSIDPNKAIKDFSKAIRLNPEDAKAYLQRGIAYGLKNFPESKSDKDKAIADFTKAIQLDPKYTSAYIHRGLAYSGLDDDKAVADLNEAVRLDPKSKQVYSYRSLFYASKHDYDKAIADQDKIIRLDPSAGRYGVRGTVYKLKGDFDKAIADYDEAIRLDPKVRSNLIDRGEVYEAKGDTSRAITDYTNAIQLGPDSFESIAAYIYRGKAYGFTGDHTRAMADFEQAAHLSSSSDIMYDKLADMLATSPHPGVRDGKKAVECATKACELSKWKEPDFIDTLAAAYAEAGDFDKAIKWETKYIKSPGLSQKDIADAKLRLALYQAGKPYHKEI